MDSVLTLIGPAGGLDDRLADGVRRALAAVGAESAPPAWLARGRAVDLAFGGAAPEAAEAAARDHLGERPLDVIAQETADRRKMLLIADMDATIVTGETLDELADFAGIKEQVAAITARAMNGEMDFAQALRERIALLRGLPIAALEATYARMTYTPGAETLVRTMRAAGAFTVLVSGGFRFFTSRVRAHCGFDRDLSNELEVENGRLTGHVIEPIIDRRSKLGALIATAAERRLPLPLTLAVGDGANDLMMIRAAGLGVAFHAKPLVAAEAAARIDHGDLTALLFAQGYREDEFVR